MDSHQTQFVEDALDLLNELDEGLLQLEANPQASAPLEQVFRTMHTIKGGANMFGFENIGELAHQLEALYDLVRSGSLQITDALISITLQAFDKVRDLLREKDVTKISDPETLKEHVAIATEYLKSVQGEASGSTPQSDGSSTQKTELATFFIRIMPNISLTADGTHPLVFILQDLEGLGTSRRYCYKQENEQVAHWDLFLSTTTPLAEIQSYFIFVENDCQVTYLRLLGDNLFAAEEFNQFIDRHVHAPVVTSELTELAARLSDTLVRSSVNDDINNDEQPAASKQRSYSDTYIKVGKRKIDDLLNWISELIILQAQLTNAASTINSPELTDVTEQLEMVTSRLRDTSLEIGLVQIETLVTKFKRVVRDLSKALDKKVNFLSEGAETEMDKDVIELMGEPMIHIIRNSIDHGIELPEQRKLAGKPEHGTVKLKAFNTSSYANIIISDDGKGIDKEKVLIKAIEKGLVAAGSQLTDEEILNLIFHPGLSTASAVSEVSGRGVGMDAVKQKINDLRGYISISSTPGKGTSIHIKLPLSRSIIEGLLVKVDDTRYVVPLNVVDRIDRISYESLDRKHHLNETVVVNEKTLSVFSLRQKFHSTTSAPRTSDVISVNINGTTKGIAVDRIEGKMQTVMKPLGDVYQRQNFISGSTILGDGSLALVLDPTRLFQLN